MVLHVAEAHVHSCVEIACNQEIKQTSYQAFRISYQVSRTLRTTIIQQTNNSKVVSPNELIDLVQVDKNKTSQATSASFLFAVQLMQCKMQATSRAPLCWIPVCHVNQRRKHTVAGRVITANFSGCAWADWCPVQGCLTWW